MSSLIPHSSSKSLMCRGHEPSLRSRLTGGESSGRMAVLVVVMLGDGSDRHPGARVEDVQRTCGSLLEPPLLN